MYFCINKSIDKNKSEIPQAGQSRADTAHPCAAPPQTAHCMSGFWVRQVRILNSTNSVFYLLAREGHRDKKLTVHRSEARNTVSSRSPANATNVNRLSTARFFLHSIYTAFVRHALHEKAYAKTKKALFHWLSDARCITRIQNMCLF